MPRAVLDGLSLVDPLGRALLATTLGCLLSAVATTLYARRRYAALQRELEQPGERLAHSSLARIIGDALEATRRGGAGHPQAVIEARFQEQLGGLLLAERFVKAATGLVIILGLLGTFYGLTLSIGRIVGLVSGDVAAGSDVAGAVTTGLTHALSGMAVAFSNSLVGIASAVILTVLGVFANVTDRRLALMLRLETLVERLAAERGVEPRGGQAPLGDGRGFYEATLRLEEVVARFEAGLATFAANSREFHQFNAHLKDNIQRMSLSFGDLSEALKGQVATLKGRDGR